MIKKRTRKNLNLKKKRKSVKSKKYRGGVVKRKKSTRQRDSSLSLSPSPSQSIFPVFKDLEGTLMRLFVVLPLPENVSWFSPNISFYQSSGLSNNDPKTKGIWMPVFGILEEKNRKYFSLFTGEQNKLYEKDDGYIIKMSVLYQAHNLLPQPDTQTIDKTQMYTLNMSELLQDFFVYLKNKFETEEEIKIHFSNDFSTKIHTYFSEVWHIIYSMILSQDAQENTLWKSNPEFTNFLKERNEEFAFISSGWDSKKWSDTETFLKYDSRERKKEKNTLTEFLEKNNVNWYANPMEIIETMKWKNMNYLPSLKEQTFRSMRIAKLKKRNTLSVIQNSTRTDEPNQS